MGINYAKLAKTATRLIADNGKKVTLKVISETYDPVTGGTVQTEVPSIVDAVVLPASGGKVQALDERLKLDGITYTKLAYMQLSGQFIPDGFGALDKVDASNETWTVIGVTPLNPNDGKPLLYGVALRQ